MSSVSSYPIRCPRCQAEIEARLFDAVNVHDMPELREAILADRLNRVQCGTCGLSFRVDKDLFYLDPDRGFAIWWSPNGRTDPTTAEQQFQDMQSRLAAQSDLPRYTWHLVYDRRELVERMFIAEAGLDVRVVEYVKYLIYSRNREKLDPAQRRLLYAGQPADSDYLQFVVENTGTGRLEGVVEYPRKGYDEVAALFSGPQAQSLLELFPGPHLDARALLQDDSIPPDDLDDSSRADDT